MSIEYSNNLEYETQQESIDENRRKEADKEADRLYNKALSLAGEIILSLAEYQEYYSDLDKNELSNLAEQIGNAISEETREFLNRGTK